MNDAPLIFSAQAAIALFVILNPFGNIPIFLSLTPKLDEAGRARVIRKSSLTALAILLVFAAAGQVIFHLFSITIGAFRIAGGVLLFLMAIEMLYGLQSRAKIHPADQAEAASKDDVAITPLGTPMVAGPGAISTVLSLMDQAGPWSEKILVFLAVPVAVAAGHAVLRAGAPLMTRTGESGLRVMTRMMGLILAVIAVQFIINGLRDALPQILAR